MCSHARLQYHGVVSGRFWSLSILSGSITNSGSERHAEDCVDEPAMLMAASARSHEAYGSTTVLNNLVHASGQVSYSSRLGQVDTTAVGSITSLPSFGLQAEPEQQNVRPRVDSPAPISQLQDHTSQQTVQDALEYEKPRICDRRSLSMQLVSFCWDVEREDPRSVVARAAEAFPDVPYNVSEPDYGDLGGWEQHYCWDHLQASGAGPDTARDLWCEPVSPLSPTKSPGYGHGPNDQ